VGRSLGSQAKARAARLAKKIEEEDAPGCRASNIFFCLKFIQLVKNPKGGILIGIKDQNKNQLQSLDVQPCY